VAVPGSKTAVADLDAKDVMLQGAVIWLDDPLLRPDGFTIRIMLDRIAGRRLLTRLGRLQAGDVRAM
jgi:hypothetical protein